jgi:rod shape-determining protein MreD
MQRIVLYTIASIIFIIVDATLVKFLAIADIVPDILLLWVVYIAIREGQIASTTAGFVIGLIVSLAGGATNMLGLTALAKTVAGFTAGYFYNENKTFQTLGGYQFLVAIALASLVHNIIYFIILLQGSGTSWSGSLMLYGIPTTLYTIAVGLMPMFAFARKYIS